jgi:acylphosphatase
MIGVEVRMPIRGERVIVRGRVQGVGFRMFALGSASSLGVRGTVRNLADGSVEVIATGDDARLAAFRRELAQGPPGARVEAIEVRELVPPPDFDRFRVTGESD